MGWVRGAHLHHISVYIFLGSRRFYIQFFCLFFWGLGPDFSTHVEPNIQFCLDVLFRVVPAGSFHGVRSSMFFVFLTVKPFYIKFVSGIWLTNKSNLAMSWGHFGEFSVKRGEWWVQPCHVTGPLWLNSVGKPFCSIATIFFPFPYNIAMLGQCQVFSKSWQGWTQYSFSFFF